MTRKRLRFLCLDMERSYVVYISLFRIGCRKNDLGVPLTILVALLVPRWLAELTVQLRVRFPSNDVRNVGKANIAYTRCLLREILSRGCCESKFWRTVKNPRSAKLSAVQPCIVASIRSCFVMLMPNQSINKLRSFVGKHPVV